MSQMFSALAGGAFIASILATREPGFYAYMTVVASIGAIGAYFLEKVK